MARTIKEMAEEYAYTNWQSDDYHDGAAEGLEFDAIGHTEKSYLAGANAVLDIINNELMRSLCNDYEGFTDEDREIAHGAIARIYMWLKQLKGE